MMVDIETRWQRFEELLQKIIPIPDEWEVEAKSHKKEAKTAKTLETLPCNTYRDLTTSWRKALKWTPGLDKTLSVMLASIASTRSVGVQLWVRVLGPPSCGKSVLCEAVSVSKFVIAKSTLRGFHSGMHNEGGDDLALIAQVNDKTLVIKDGDTLLQSPNLGQILSEARDLYDTVSRTSYRNKASKDYLNIRMTFLLCGTSSLRSLDESELGERFLDCVLMDRIEESLEDEILMRSVASEAKGMAIESDGTAENNYSPPMTLAMQLTGGYVDWLRNNAASLLEKLVISDDVLWQLTRLGKFVAFMRSRPSKRQSEYAEREVGARLAKQHTRLATCLAIVLNKSEVDDEVMQRVCQVSFDTARGITFSMLKVIHEHGQDGIECVGVAKRTSLNNDSDCRKLLKFLRQIQAVEWYHPIRGGKVSSSVQKWRLTESFRKLYDDVMTISEKGKK